MNENVPETYSTCGKLAQCKLQQTFPLLSLVKAAVLNGWRKNRISSVTCSWFLLVFDNPFFSQLRCVISYIGTLVAQPSQNPVHTGGDSRDPHRRERARVEWTSSTLSRRNPAAWWRCSPPGEPSDSEQLADQPAERPTSTSKKSTGGK